MAGFGFRIWGVGLWLRDLRRRIQVDSVEPDLALYRGSRGL